MSHAPAAHDSHAHDSHGHDSHGHDSHGAHHAEATPSSPIAIAGALLVGLALTFATLWALLAPRA